MTVQIPMPELTSMNLAIAYAITSFIIWLPMHYWVLIKNRRSVIRINKEVKLHNSCSRAMDHTPIKFNTANFLGGSFVFLLVAPIAAAICAVKIVLGYTIVPILIGQTWWGWTVSGVKNYIDDQTDFTIYDRN